MGAFAKALRSWLSKLTSRSVSRVNVHPQPTNTDTEPKDPGDGPENVQWQERVW